MLTYWEIETEDPRPSASGSRLMTGQVKAFVDLVAKMRRAQAAHRKTLIYGYRTESIHLEAEVDAALKELQGSIG